MVVSVHSNVEKDRGRLTPTPFRPLRPKLPRTRRRCGCGPINRFPMSLAKKVGMYRNIYYYHKWYLGWGCVSNVFWVRVKTKPMIFTDVPQEWRVWRYNQQICSPNVLIWKPLVGWPHWQTDAPLDATWTDLDGLGSSLHLVKWIAVTFWISPSLVVSITVFGRLRIS